MKEKGRKRWWTTGYASDCVTVSLYRSITLRNKRNVRYGPNIRNVRPQRNARINTASIRAFWPLRRLLQLRSLRT